MAFIQIHLTSQDVISLGTGSWNPLDTRSTGRDQVERSGSRFLHGYCCMCVQPRSSALKAEECGVLCLASFPHRPPVECSCTCFALSSTRVWPLCFVSSWFGRGRTFSHWFTTQKRGHSPPMCGQSPVRNLAMGIQYLEQNAQRLTGPPGPFGLLQHKVKPRSFQPLWAWYHRPSSLVCLNYYFPYYWWSIVQEPFFPGFLILFLRLDSIVRHYRSEHAGAGLWASCPCVKNTNSPEVVVSLTSGFSPLFTWICSTL